MMMLWYMVGEMALVLRFLSWIFSLFFMAGDNREPDRMAMEPAGHIAGTAASVISALTDWIGHLPRF